MTDKDGSFLYGVFRFLIAKRWWVIAAYLLVLVPSVYFSLKVEQDNSLDRLIVQSDPSFVVSKNFERAFGTGEYVVILLEADDPFHKDVVSRLLRLEEGLNQIGRLEVSSILSVYSRAKAGFSPTDEEIAALRRFAGGTDIFRKQGLVGDHFFGLPIVFSVTSPKDRAKVLGSIDGVVDKLVADKGPITAVRRVGQPYVNAYLDKNTNEQGMRYFPLFGLFVLVLNVALYRSLRALLAFLLTLGVNAAMTVGFIGATGGDFTIVSSLVPMTILITCTATLVYIHSRFVECPPGRSADDHQIFALVNKFLACTASIFATAVGFAALAVSKIRPIREMGIWVAIGLVFTWLLVFTLFPALQKILKTPTQQERKIAGQGFLRFIEWLPRFAYRTRWLMVPGSLLLCVGGLVALFGLPFGLLSPMELQTKPLEYINHDSDLYKDTKKLETMIAGLSVTEVWLQGSQGSLVRPEVLRGLSHFEMALAKEEMVGSVIGLTTMLRTLRYVAGKGDTLPEDDESLERITDGFETLLPKQPMVQRFVDRAGGIDKAKEAGAFASNLAGTHMTVITKSLDDRGFETLTQRIKDRFHEAQKRDPALAGFKLDVTGFAPLEARISAHLVPTLIESFWLTIVIIFLAFLLIFRNGAARLMAMIPSLFAILVMFIFMRLFGMNLNVATILIASTVLGTSENDQIHFFYHFLEGQKEGTTEKALRHALLIAGRAIFFATLINAGGFLAFALAELPPVRQFGILAALAFVLSMLADFTALISALWLVFRARPDLEPGLIEPKPDKIPS